MKLAEAIEIANRFVSDCFVSPAHLMPRPDIRTRHALQMLVVVAEGVRDAKAAEIERPDMSGCA